MVEPKPVVGVRLDPPFRDEIKAAAEHHFGGNESLFLREAARVYLRLLEHAGSRHGIVVSDLIARTGKEAA